MTKVIQRLALSLVMLTSFSILSHAQAFKKDDIVIDLGVNFSYYNTTNQSSAPGSAVQSSHLGGGVYSAGVEYGLANWFGVGVKLRYDDYITKDSVTHPHPSATGYDALIIANFHFIKTKHLDIPIGVGYGYSGLKYTTQDSVASNLSGRGAIFDVHVDPRIYFGNHIGINFHVAYTYFGYPEVIYNDNKTGNKPNTSNLTATGINIGVGLQFKF